MPPSRPRPPIRRRAALLGAAILGLFLGLVVFREPLLRAAAAPLQVDRAAPEPVDRLLLAEGHGRVRLAARWVAEGRADGVLLLRPRPSRPEQQGLLDPAWWPEMRALVDEGLPRRRIEVLEIPVGTPHDAARALADWMEGHPGKSVRILCPALYSATLAAAVDDTVPAGAGPVTWHPLPDRRFGGSWWTDKNGVLLFFEAWIHRVHPAVFGWRGGATEGWDPAEWARIEARHATAQPAERDSS